MVLSLRRPERPRDRELAPPSGLALRQIAHTYRSSRSRTPAIDCVDLAIESGEFVSIVGPTGCGKSTLLRIAGGLIEPTGGSVDIDGRSSHEARAAKRIGFVFQDPALLPWRTARANVELAGELNRRRASSGADELLALVGLRDAVDRRPHELSGGMRQRVALARALALDPSVLLMDEPFAALDEITRETMRYELLRIWEQRRSTVVFVTHSIREAIALSDRVVVLTPGPARVRAGITIDLPRPRRYEMERDPAFLDYVDRIRELLT